MDITKFTVDYGNVSLCNCTDNEYSIDIIVPVFLYTIPRGLSFFCLISIILQSNLY